MLRPARNRRALLGPSFTAAVSSESWGCARARCDPAGLRPVGRRVAARPCWMRWPGLPLRWQRAVGASLRSSCGPTLTPDGVARRPRLARSQLVAER